MDLERTPATSTRSPLGSSNGMSDPEIRQVVNRLDDQQINPVRGNFDLPHLQAIHASTFRNVVGDWAGELRQIDLAKRGQDGLVSTFVAAKDIEKGGEAIAERIKDADQFRGLTKDEWAKGIAQTYADLNQLHPFRNGNDTANREFIRVLGREGGFDVDYSKVNVQDWQRASVESFKGNAEPVQKVFEKISEPTRELDLNGRAREGFRIDLDSSSIKSGVRGDDVLNSEAKRLGLEVMRANELSTMEGNVKGVVVSAKDDFVIIKTSETKAIAIDKEAVHNLKLDTGSSVVVRQENNALYFEGQGQNKERVNEIGIRVDKTYGER
jgi:fido (protein-threonine AMPylation protein)